VADVSRRLLSAVVFPNANARDTRVKLEGLLDPFCRAKRVIDLPIRADDLDAERKTVLAKPGRKRHGRHAKKGPRRTVFRVAGTARIKPSEPI
jgi:hypothetical protein